MHIFDLSCSTVMPVKYSLSETCDLSPRNLFKSKRIIYLYQKNNWKAVCGALVLAMLNRRSLPLQKLLHLYQDYFLRTLRM